MNKGGILFVEILFVRDILLDRLVVYRKYFDTTALIYSITIFLCRRKICYAMYICIFVCLFGSC